MASDVVGWFLAMFGYEADLDIWLSRILCGCDYNYLFRLLVGYIIL